MGSASAFWVVVDALGRAVWPERCGLCDARDRGDGLGCDEHRFEVGLSGPRCRRCAAAVAGMLAHGELCPGCRARSPGIATVAALGAYRAAANADWLLALKYGGRPDLAAPLGALLAARLALEPSAPEGARRVLVPVPLHVARRVERGYDQAGLLARACGAEAALPVVRALRRRRATSVQGEIGTASRAANVRGAFAPAFGARIAASLAARLALRLTLQSGARPIPRRGAHPIAGADAWLVDDVLTSGSTAAECARVLRRLGAARVSVLCVARA